MGNQQQIPDVPRDEVVVHEIKIRRLVVLNGVHHRPVGTGERLKVGETDDNNGQSGSSALPIFR